MSSTTRNRQRKSASRMFVWPLTSAYSSTLLMDRACSWSRSNSLGSVVVGCKLPRQRDYRTVRRAQRRWGRPQAHGREAL